MFFISWYHDSTKIMQLNFKWVLCKLRKTIILIKTVSKIVTIVSPSSLATFCHFSNTIKPAIISLTKTCHVIAHVSSDAWHIVWCVHAGLAAPKLGRIVMLCSSIVRTRNLYQMKRILRCAIYNAEPKPLII